MAQEQILEKIRLLPYYYCAHIWQFVLESLELNNSNDVFSNPGFDCKKEKGDDGKLVKLELSSPVGLIVNLRCSGKDQNVICVFSGTLSISTEDFSILKYNTRVSYFGPWDDNNRVDDSEFLEHLCSYHFDMTDVDNDPLGHPVFHLQLSKLHPSHREVIEESRLWTIKEDENGHGFNAGSKLKHIRFPTPQLDFLRLPVQLNADHYLGQEASDSTQDKFKQLLTKIQKCEYVPIVDSSRLVDRCNEAKSVCSLSWYSLV